MNTRALEKECEPAQIKQRKGRRGMMLDYVETPKRDSETECSV